MRERRKKKNQVGISFNYKTKFLIICNNSS